MKIGKHLKLFHKSHDGGKDSGVTGYWLIECKPLFSIVLLRFSKGTREAYHSHAFNALTWWIKGRVREEYLNGSESKEWRPSFLPKYTPRSNAHRVVGLEVTWALSIRGPWRKEWIEVIGNKVKKLTHGRKVIAVTELEDMK